MKYVTAGDASVMSAIQMPADKASGHRKETIIETIPTTIRLRASHKRHDRYKVLRLTLV